MKYLRLFEDFDSHDPYELMIIPPNKKAEMIKREVQSYKPNINLIQDLIILGAKLDWQDEEGFNQGNTILHWVASDHRTEIRQIIAKMLIDAGVDVNVQNEKGRTALIFATKWNYIEIVQMLIDAKADLNIQDEIGNTALHYAVEYYRPEIALMLIDAGANRDIQNNHGETPYEFAGTKELQAILKV